VVGVVPNETPEEVARQATEFKAAFPVFADRGLAAADALGATHTPEVFLEPGRVYPVNFDIGWTSLAFNKGHRIRVTVASTGAPFYEPNPNTGEPLTLDPPGARRGGDESPPPRPHPPLAGHSPGPAALTRTTP
jgi:hypothetical protein